MTILRTIEADITKMKVDVIVNAANMAMLGGGGVDGAIHRAAGPQLRDACEAFPMIDRNVRVPTGGVRITPAFNLPCKYIIHTAGPIWNGGFHHEADELESCYNKSLILAALHGKSVAIPAISTGIFGYPIADACQIATRTCFRHINAGSDLKAIYLVTFKSPEVSECFKSLEIQSGE